MRVKEDNFVIQFRGTCSIAEWKTVFDTRYIVPKMASPATVMVPLVKRAHVSLAPFPLRWDVPGSILMSVAHSFR
jgi:hypothetical protein